MTQTPEYRSIDGSGNNTDNTELNQAGTNFSRIGPTRYTDGYSTMVTAPDAPNARYISDTVVADPDPNNRLSEAPNAEGLAGWMYAWGQFVDHDIDLMKSDGKNHIDISLNNVNIPMTRTKIDPVTGTAELGKPSAAVNNITGWLDASQVYGSDVGTAAKLWDPKSGKMLTSQGNNLPIDPQTGQFMAGDERVQENPDLTAIQALFVREHNYQVDQLKAAHSDWNGEQLYNQAKAIVTAEINHITYNEFLPHLLGKGAIAPYEGYNPNVDASISEEFAGAAYRLGHSLVSNKLEHIDELGGVTHEESLADSFLTNDSKNFQSNGGADGLLRHLSADKSNALDVHIVDDLRNALFAPPATIDLAATNIQRGRDLGLGTLNQTREALHLKAYTDFNQITSDPSTAEALRTAYGSVDKVDLWVGGLAEDHVKGGMVGTTFNKIVSDQFEALRDGDRLWYQNQGFDRATLKGIEATTLSDVILRNTDTKNIQPDAFVFYERRSSQAVAEDPSAPQLVIGSDGNDTLIGGKANDILVAGGSGQKVMTGFDGRDTFIFDQIGISARITDFNVSEDMLKFDHLGQPGPCGVQLVKQGMDTVLTFGGDTVTLLGVQPNQIHQEKIMFG